MIYSQNRQNIFEQMKARTTRRTTEAAIPTSFAEKYRTLSMRTIILLAGCLLLLAFCAVSVMQISIQLRTEDLLAGAKAVCQIMTKGSAVSAIPVTSSN